MTAQRVIFHVGLPKTATTAVQFWLSANSAALADAGFYYPVEKSASGVPKQQSIVRELLAGQCRSLSRYVTDARWRTLLLSTEGMANHLYDFSADALKKFSKAVGKRELVAFIVLRDPNKWLQSYYVQAILNPRVDSIDYYATGMRLDEFAEHPRVSALLNQPQLTADLASRLGAEVVVGKYEDDWIGQFCSTFHIPLSQSDVPRVNQSPPRWAVELMRQFNAAGMNNAKRYSWQDVIQRLTRGTHTLGLVADERSRGEPAELSDLAAVVPGGEGEFLLEQAHIDQLSSFLRTERRACA